jgi:hypothetical protein
VRTHAGCNYVMHVNMMLGAERAAVCTAAANGCQKHARIQAFACMHADRHALLGTGPVAKARTTSTHALKPNITPCTSSAACQGVQGNKSLILEISRSCLPQPLAVSPAPHSNSFTSRHAPAAQLHLGQADSAALAAHSTALVAHCTCCSLHLLLTCC